MCYWSLNVHNIVSQQYFLRAKNSPDKPRTNTVQIQLKPFSTGLLANFPNNPRQTRLRENLHRRQFNSFDC